MTLTREALANQIADDLATRNANSGLIEGGFETLEADVTTPGSVLKSINDNAEDATFTPVGDLDAVTIGGALGELDSEKANTDDIVDDFIGGLGKIASANDTKELYELIDTRVYGLDINETTGANTRLLDAVGMTIGAPDGTVAITSSFDSVYPWSEMKHVKVSVAGVKILQTDVGYDAFDGELMTRIPEFWYKDYRSGGHRYLYISRKKRLGFKQKAEQLIASMPASKVGTEFRSRVGEAPQTNISYTNFITGMYAQGDNKWSMYDSNVQHSLFLLSVIEGGSLNHKGMYGQGINADTEKRPVTVEQFNTMGDGSGYILVRGAENKSNVCYRGIWDLWGNVWQFNAGFMRYDGQYYGCADITKYNVTDPRGADGWSDLGIGDYAANGYQQIREGVEVEGGMIDVPILWGAVAGSVTFYSAYLYNFTDAYTGARVLFLGGSWHYGGNVSLVSSNGYYSPSVASVDVGSRLIR